MKENFPHFLLLILSIILIVASTTCGGGGGDGTTADGGQVIDYSGTYCVYLNDVSPLVLSIDQSGSDVACTLTGPDNETIFATGTVSGNTLAFTGNLTEGGEVSATLSFSGDGQSFTGNYNVTGENPDQGSLTGETGECVSSLPDVSTINAEQSDTFVVPLTDLGGKVDGVAPMPGSLSGCYHSGAHIVFRTPSTLETVDIISPVDGIVSYVNNCFTYADGARDQYKIHLSYAQRDSSLFDLEFAIEPMAGKLCSSGNPDYFTPYILVQAGDSVTKGQKIGEMVMVPGYQAHIHLNSRYQGEFICPDIFNGSVIDVIDDYYGNVPDTCGGVPYDTIAAGTICYQPGPEESHDDY